MSRLRPSGDVDPANTRGSAASASNNRGAGAPSTDDLSLSSGALSLPDALRQGPPIDKALVEQIGAAIAEGRYPIKPDLIAEAMFRDVHALNP
ncbi:flagellar biosynthesis anti-sigma factor FlgM [Pseudotabrizicola algicola]|uniref:flagellar biosynthesis anti-sigma factor FlgM n=1 Tax=Pseudotabrizicola algicola TaxID=2709381 RepID=UPI00338DA60D